MQCIVMHLDTTFQQLFLSYVNYVICKYYIICTTFESTVGSGNILELFVCYCAFGITLVHSVCYWRKVIKAKSA